MVKINGSLEHIFNPRSIAIVGVSDEPLNFASTVYVATLLRFQFAGPIYPVGPEGDEVSGLKIYRRIVDIPGPVDLVIIAIPASAIPQVMMECIAKEARAVHIFSSGFSESGKEEGISLEREIVALARRGGISIIGPNCMGLYNPSASLSFGYNFPMDGGPVAYLSQSGGNAFHLVRAAAARGLRFSKVASYGNAADIDESDLLDYFAADSQTGVIAAYIEGVKDGRRFISVLKEAARAKPTIVFKGGTTEVGRRAVASHTGALAGSDGIWEGLLRQAGAVRADSIEELVDLLITFLLMPLPTGRRVALVGVGGGASVHGADQCARAGLLVPPLSQEIVRRLGKIFGGPGISLENPVDTNVLDVSPEQFGDVLKTVAVSPEIDFIIAHVGVDLGPFTWHRVEVLERKVETIVRAAGSFQKPVAMVLHTATSGRSIQAVAEVQQRYSSSGLPIYNSIGAAARAIGKFLDHHQRNKI
jgi:acyl-CoA synthetase (NDP forming)